MDAAAPPATACNPQVELRVNLGTPRGALKSQEPGASLDLLKEAFLMRLSQVAKAFLKATGFREPAAAAVARGVQGRHQGLTEDFGAAHDHLHRPRAINTHVRWPNALAKSAARPRPSAQARPSAKRRPTLSRRARLR